MNSAEKKDRKTTVLAIVVFYVIAIALGYWFGGRQDELVVGRGRLPFPEQLLRRIQPAHWHHHCSAPRRLDRLPRFYEQKTEKSREYLLKKEKITYFCSQIFEL